MYQLAKFSRLMAKPPLTGAVEAAAWKSAVVGAGGSVSAGRESLVSSLIGGLKSSGVWTKLDRLWLLAAENAQSASIDLKALSALTPIGSPTFTTDRGYVGQDSAGPTAYIESNFVPSSGTTFTQDSAHISAWSRTNTATSGGGALGGVSGTNLFITYSDGNVYSRINDASESGSQGAPGTRIGHWIANRSGASATQVYQSGSLFNSPNATSGARSSNELFILASNSSGSPTNGTPNQVTMFSAGGSLTSGEAANFYSRLQTYMTAVGA